MTRDRLAIVALVLLMIILVHQSYIAIYAHQTLALAVFLASNLGCALAINNILGKRV